MYQNGSTYHGTFDAGRMHGQGRYEWPDGLVYEGEFVQGEIFGTGEYTWPNGETYEGGVQMGLRHGTGRQVLEGGEVVFEGTWVHGLRHGQGTIAYNAEHTSFYEGERLPEENLVLPFITESSMFYVYVLFWSNRNLVCE